jgi:hypothetical protein
MKVDNSYKTRKIQNKSNRSILKVDYDRQELVRVIFQAFDSRWSRKVKTVMTKD